MKRRIFSLLLMIVLMINMLPLSGCGNREQSDAVTRGEWITMLSEAFGMDSYAEDTPYYSDVVAGTALFPYVQSAVEWDVLSIFTGDTLEADKKVIREEVASTAAIAAGCDVSEDQFDDKGKFDSAASIEYAIQYGMLENDKGLSKSMTLEECEAVLSAARNAYLNAPIEEKIYVAADENLVDLTDLDSDMFSLEGNRMTIPGSYSGGVAPDATGELKATIDTGDGIVEVGVGEVFVTAPTADKPAGVAYKISSIEEVDGEIVFTTEEPTLYDLYEELDVHETISADTSNIIWLVGDGSSATLQGVSGEGGDTYHIELLSSQPETPQVILLDEKTYNWGGFSKHFKFGNGSFEKNWSNHNSSAIGSGEGAQALEERFSVIAEARNTRLLSKLKESLRPIVEQLEIPFTVDGIVLGESGIGEAKGAYSSRPYAYSNLMNDDTVDTVYTCFGMDTPIPEGYEVDQFGFLFSEPVDGGGIDLIEINDPGFTCLGSLHVGDTGSAALEYFGFPEQAPIGNLDWSLSNGATLNYSGYSTGNYEFAYQLDTKWASVEVVDGVIHNIHLEIER